MWRPQPRHAPSLALAASPPPDLPCRLTVAAVGAVLRYLVRHRSAGKCAPGARGALAGRRLRVLRLVVAHAQRGAEVRVC